MINNPAVDARINLGIILKGTPTEIEKALRLIEKISGVTIAYYKISSDKIWVTGREDRGDVL